MPTMPGMATARAPLTLQIHRIVDEELSAARERIVARLIGAEPERARAKPLAPVTPLPTPEPVKFRPPPAGKRLRPRQLDELADRVLALFRRGVKLAAQEVMDATGLDRHRATDVLGRLVARGRVVRTGRQAGTRYALR